MEKSEEIRELKKRLGLEKPVIHAPITIKKDGKHLYYVGGFFFPLKWQTIERLQIPPNKILSEVDREEWRQELEEAREKKEPQGIDPWD